MTLSAGPSGARGTYTLTKKNYSAFGDDTLNVLRRKQKKMFRDLLAARNTARGVCFLFDFSM